jgi:hypothetical protein
VIHVCVSRGLIKLLRHKALGVPTPCGWNVESSPWGRQASKPAVFCGFCAF